MTTAGFLYLSDLDELSARVTVGERLATERLGPPWLVVDHALERVVVARWPGRLFLVAVAPPGSDEERAALASAAAGLRPDAGYTRAFAVDVIEELPRASLFGAHGEAVEGVLALARRLDRGQAARLAAAGTEEASEAYSAAWERWLSRQPNGDSYLGDNSSTLAVPGAGRTQSPIGAALMVLSTLVRESARERGGEGAFEADEEGEESLGAPWSGALHGLLHAAMALGAPELVDAAQGRTLRAAWDAAGGAPRVVEGEGE